MKKMLTKEECYKALRYITNLYEELYITRLNESGNHIDDTKEYWLLEELINEHFDNPKTSLEISDWIPCKERMPKDSRNVVITTSSNVVGVGSYLGNGWVQWYSGGGMVVDVLAWRELPKPYMKEIKNVD